MHDYMYILPARLGQCTKSIITMQKPLVSFFYYKGFDWTENQTIVVLSDIRLPQFINNNNKLLILILIIIIIVIVIIIVIIVSLFTLCSIYSSIFGAKQIHETNNLNQTLQG